VSEPTAFTYVSVMMCSISIPLFILFATRSVSSIYYYVAPVVAHLEEDFNGLPATLICLSLSRDKD
jgi:hypothetical protein